MDNQFRMTVSQTARPASDDQLRARINRRHNAAEALAERFWNSGIYFPLLCAIAAVSLFARVEFVGMMVLAVITISLQVLVSDLLAALLPALLVLLLGTSFYDTLAVLVPLWWIVVLWFFSFVYNFIHFKKRLHKSACFNSLIAVSFATILGGIGYISKAEYFSYVTVLYGFGLGGLMLIVSVVYGSSLSCPRTYDLGRRFAAILYSVGLFTACIVVNYYIVHFAEIAAAADIPFISFRNYLTTMFLMALPMPFRFVKDSKLHLVSVAFMYGTLLLDGSRSGLVFGTIVIAVCVFLTVNNGKKLTRRERSMILPYLAVAACIIFVLCQTVLSSRLVDGQLFPMSDSRIDFIKQSIKDFIAHPINGIGLANMQNSVIFIGTKGSMVWYHNYFAQIIGSMGLLGIFAYGWLLRDRVRLVKRMYYSGEAMIAMAYVGMFLVSMTNPGEFCPFPNEFLMVILFDVALNLRTHDESTVSGESISVSWTPSKRMVPLGIYDKRSNTTSTCAGNTDIDFAPEDEGENVQETIEIHDIGDKL